jgi:hypothetical protein
VISLTISVILNQIVWKLRFKKLRFENKENLLFQIAGKVILFGKRKILKANL